MNIIIEAQWRCGLVSNISDCFWCGLLFDINTCNDNDVLPFYSKGKQAL